MSNRRGIDFLYDEWLAGGPVNLSGDFNIKEYGELMETVKIETIDRLKKLYDTEDVTITADYDIRTLDEQAKHLHSGASKTSLGLHNLGAAGDFLIAINGNTIHGKKDLTPYKVLGGVAAEHDLFWGWEGDAGHVAAERFVSDLLEDNPKLIHEEGIGDSLQKWYEIQNSLPENATVSSYTLGELDKLYNEVHDRTYTGDDRVLDELIDPITLHMIDASGTLTPPTE